jgi:hypothetical protein
MHVHTQESLTDLNKISIVSEATYAHEFIHFLQDITCVYGLMNICSIVDYLKLLNNQPLSDHSSELNVPFTPMYSIDNNVQTNWSLKEIYLGAGKGMNNIAKVDKICKCFSPVASNNGTKTEEKVILEFIDSQHRIFQYSIGAFCILESMAYTMEKVLYPSILPVPNKLPYDSVNIICDFILPGFSNDPLNIIALCDACLMLFHPGKFLYDTLQEMAKTDFMPTKPEDVYAFVFNNVNFNFNGHTTHEQLLLSFSAEAISQLGDYFTTPLFKENRHWINYMITSAIDIRLHYPYFMLELVRNGQLKNNKTFSVLLRKIGSPLVVNDNFELTLAYPPLTSYDIVPEYLWIIYQIYKMCSYNGEDGGLINNTYKCEMIEWCKASAIDQKKDDWTDYDRCRNAPWERASDPDPNYCTFGKIWKTWGLKDIKPVNLSDILK